MERSIEQLEEIEERLREGKVVKIEPMPGSVVPLPQPAGVLKKEMTRDDCLKIADRIGELSDQILWKKEGNHRIALKVGDGPYSNVVTVNWRKDSVSFHIPSSDLMKQAIEADFSPEYRPGKGGAFFNHKRYFYRLALADLQKHEPLFRAIVKDSLNYVLSRRTKGK